MKTARMTVDGQEYLLCFSVRVIKDCMDRYGAVENIGNVFDNSDPLEAMDEAIWLLTKMMDAGERYAKMHGISNPKALTYDDFVNVCDAADLASMKDKIFETITSGSAAEVEVEPSKNAEATPSM